MNQYSTAPAHQRRGSSPRLCFIADPRSIHTVRWMEFFAMRGYTVALVSQHAPSSELNVAACYPLSERSGLPGTRLLRNVFELRRAIRDFRPDVLHAHYINECGWLGALSGFHPFVLTAWGSDVYLAPKQSRLARALTPWSVGRADYVTADSQDQIERLREMGADEGASQVINWGVDLDKFSGRGGTEWRERHKIGLGRTVILSPRQWIENSNIDLIIQAFARARALQPDALLVLKHTASTRDGVRRKIAAQVEGLGLSGSVMVIGEVAAEELPGMYAAADITVSVCTSDGTPVSVLEAMASKSAVIAGDLPSLREWVRDGSTGFLAGPRDANQLAQQMMRLLGDAELRRQMGEAGRRTVARKGDRVKNLSQVEAAYMRLIEAEGKKPGCLESILHGRNAQRRAGSKANEVAGAE